MDAIIDYLVKMFSTTNYLFGVTTTWQYMLFFLFVYLIAIGSEDTGKFFSVIIGAFAIVVNMLGLRYYLMVLFKYMWKLA